MARGVWRRTMGQAQITRGALYLLFATVGLSLVLLAGGEPVQARLGPTVLATGDGLWRRFQLWQLVTSPLFERSFIALLFQGFALWMFLPALERWWGTRRFLLFALYTSLVGTAVGTGVDLLTASGGHTVVAGLDPFIFGGFVAYGILFSNQQVQFFGVLPMTGRQLTIGIIALVGLMVVVGQDWIHGAALASSMVLSWAMVSDRFAPRLWLLRAKQRRLRRRGHLRAVPDDRDKKRWMN